MGGWKPTPRAQTDRAHSHQFKEQQAQLEALARLMRRTRFVLDDTLAAMGTIYSQVQVLGPRWISTAPHRGPHR